eukprot:m.1641163 g.1641163  ORF g.1641163 m.1641163 type:complete len:379 (-) comp45976_c0_seq1:696-1832(-)
MTMRLRNNYATATYRSSKIRQLLFWGAFANFACAKCLENYSQVLNVVRSLNVPSPDAIINGEHESDNFWVSNGKMLRAAWKAIEIKERSVLPSLVDNVYTSCEDYRVVPELLAANIHRAVTNAWKSPSPAKELAVKSVLKEVALGVYSCQLLTDEGVRRIRRYLELAKVSGIPARRPNGMNRYGIVIDDESQIDGAVSITELSKFCKHLVQDFVRPIGRMLFQANVGADDDVDTFAFTIRYSASEDTELAEHCDASVYTLNVNLNTDAESAFSGSAVYFVDPETSEKQAVQFEPGMALFHLGQTRHGAQPILTNGTRENLVIWLFGNHGDVRVAPYGAADQLDFSHRWKKPTSKDCHVAQPFNTASSDSGSRTYSKEL